MSGCYWSVKEDAIVCVVHPGGDCEPQAPEPYDLASAPPELWLMRVIAFVESDNTFSKPCRAALLAAVAALDEEYGDKCAAQEEQRRER